MNRIEFKANQLYEYYERDYNDFTNSKLRAMEHCKREIWRTESKEDKLFWIDVKNHLNKKY